MHITTSSNTLKSLGISCIVVTLMLNLWLLGYPKKLDVSRTFTFSTPVQVIMNTQVQEKENILALLTGWLLPVLLFSATITYSLAKGVPDMPKGRAWRFFLLSCTFGYLPFLLLLYPEVGKHPAFLFMLVILSPVLYPVITAIYLAMARRHFRLKASTIRIWLYAGIAGVVALAGLFSLSSNVFGTAILAEVLVWQLLTWLFLLNTVQYNRSLAASEGLRAVPAMEQA